jgi:hypothetical protein
MDPLAEGRIDVFCEIGRTFSKNWPNFTDVLAGKQFQELATLDLGVIGKVFREK